MKLYRYEKFCGHETLRGWDDENNVEIKLRTYDVIRNTPKGYVIKKGLKERWVSSTGKKRFAYADKKDALESFIRRTKRSINIMNHYIDFSQLALEKAKEVTID